MKKIRTARFLAACIFLSISTFAVSQEAARFRGSIPEELLRPGRGESPRFPVDVVIGELGSGRAPEAAYAFASSVMTGFMAGLMEHRALSSVNEAVRESHISSIRVIVPVSFRIGSGRVEADGSVSFLVRFMGRLQGITGELYVRTVQGVWAFDDLLLEEPRDLAVEAQEGMYRNDFFPYERFF
ncbi:MAG: hypothetical protein FWC01_06120 [Treponema sp.]|nr:hypothetical protein [Treponema sp.]MCL2237634.1 hypothetical protein [Treponema sp.]